MDTNKLISSLCYFSVFFAGLILPIVVYFIVDDRSVKEHAKAALLSHLIPFLSIPLFLLLFFIGEPMFMGTSVLLFVVIFGVVNLAVVIWNVVKGIKVFS
ncbi:DUF4870 domain-containing protein [Litchfieldia alkalitelluris]|uniref:DUF4870 domain-containing protein n=1 Tax=Litchfieldia alkalitelluris TaxID=304268 RepID=UPI0009972DE4|nr:DUF4870 domain-containing protein [Litchfieldia alkalitelluris]